MPLIKYAFNINIYKHAIIAHKKFFVGNEITH